LTSPAVQASFGGAGRTIELNLAKLRELGYLANRGLKLTELGTEIATEKTKDDDFG
jgi:hypothetical protein